MKLVLPLIAIILSFSIKAQNALEAFDNLVGSTWIAEGKQLGGHNGKTVKEFSWGLDGKLVKVKTYTTDPKTLEFGLRNEGVRIFNSENNMIEFYEFDKLGGITKGRIISDGKNLLYEYEYGDLTLRDSWIHIDDNQYEYTIASMKNGEQDQVYHTGIFKRK